MISRGSLSPPRRGGDPEAAHSMTGQQVHDMDLTGKGNLVPAAGLRLPRRGFLLSFFDRQRKWEIFLSCSIVGVTLQDLSI